MFYSCRPYYCGVFETLKLRLLETLLAPFQFEKSRVAFECGRAVVQKCSASSLDLISHDVSLPHLSHYYHVTLFWKGFSIFRHVSGSIIFFIPYIGHLVCYDQFRKQV